MTNKKVISAKNLPSKIPLIFTAVCLMALDIYNAPQWLWGVSITILSLLWLISIISIIMEGKIDIMNNTDDNKKNKFQERIDTMKESQDKLRDLKGARSL